MKKIFLVLCLVGSFGLNGCETLKGAGQDLQNAGQALEKAVD